MRRAFQGLHPRMHRRRRLVLGMSAGVAAASIAGIIATGALIAEHGSVWTDYRAAQDRLTAVAHDHDTAATAFDQARAAALTAFTSAKTLHDESTAHGVLLTAATQVQELGNDLTALTSTAGITPGQDGAAAVTPTSFARADAASPAPGGRAGDAALRSATAALVAQTRAAQDETTELVAKTQAVSTATSTLEAAATAAANAQHLPLTGEPAGDDPHCATVQSGERTVFVSIADQHLWACDGPQLKLDTAVTTGASAITNSDDATPTGTFSVQGKTQNTVLRGSDANGSWNDPVSYWIPFMTGVGFHDASWQSFPFGSAQYTTEGSHACVHTPVDAVAVLYTWLHVGDRVVIG